jgi:hypothetical protein
MSEDYKLKVGDKYLSISVDAKELLWLCWKAMTQGEKYINLGAFKNKDKQDSNHPDYKSGQVSVWIKTKEAKEESL